MDITPSNCEAGMILIDANQPSRRWQGSEAAEEIARLLPLGEAFIAAYRSGWAIANKSWNEVVPAIVKQFFDEQIRDNRYEALGIWQTTKFLLTNS